MTKRKLGLHSLDYPCLHLVKAKRLMMKYVLIINTNTNTTVRSLAIYINTL